MKQHVDEAGYVQTEFDSNDSAAPKPQDTVVTPQYRDTAGNSYNYDERKDAAQAEKERQAQIVADDRDSAARNANLKEMGYTAYARDAQSREDYDHMERQHKGNV